MKKLFIGLLASSLSLSALAVADLDQFVGNYDIVKCVGLDESSKVEQSNIVIKRKGSDSLVIGYSPIGSNEIDFTTEFTSINGSPVEYIDPHNPEMGAAWACNDRKVTTTLTGTTLNEVMILKTRPLCGRISYPVGKVLRTIKLNDNKLSMRFQEEDSDVTCYYTRVN